MYFVKRGGKNRHVRRKKENINDIRKQETHCITKDKAKTGTFEQCIVLAFRRV